MCLGTGKVVMISNTDMNSPGLTCGYRYPKGGGVFLSFSVVFQGLDTGPCIKRADEERVAEWIETSLISSHGRLGTISLGTASAVSCFLP